MFTTLALSILLSLDALSSPGDAPTMESISIKCPTEWNVSAHGGYYTYHCPDTGITILSPINMANGNLTRQQARRARLRRNPSR